MGEQWNGRHGGAKKCQAMCGMAGEARPGRERHGTAGVAGHGAARLGLELHGRLGNARRDMARPGMAGKAW